MTHSGKTAERGAPRGLGPELEAALRRLDLRLKVAIEGARARFGADPGQDAFRGLYLKRQDVLRALEASPGVSLSSNGSPGGSGLVPFEDIHPESSRFAWLAQSYRLTHFDASVLVVALAPEIDTRYGRAFAYLQDDVTRRRPTVELVLGLLCDDPADRLARRRHFAADAPLLNGRLVSMRRSDDSTLLTASLHVDDQILGLLLGVDRVDARLRSCARLTTSPQALEHGDPGVFVAPHVVHAVEDAARRHATLPVLLEGPAGAGKRSVSRWLAAHVGRPLLTFRLREASARCATDEDFEELVDVAFREAWFRDALLYVQDLEALLAAPETRLGALVAAAARHTDPVVLGSSDPWQAPPGALPVLLTVPLRTPGHAARQALWVRGLSACGLEADADVTERLSALFALTPGQITDAIQRARLRGTVDGDEPSSLGEALLAEARAQCGRELESYAQRIRPTRDWSHIVLPEDASTQLREMCAWVSHRHRVLDEWGFGARLVRGRGVAALFTGPSGTGKTMAAEILAHELGVDLFRIDLAGVISKYIGETEKNLDRVFRAAENASGVLFFDEADALFGRRSEVRDSHDRYANVEISYLLQKMEEYEGIAILATNLRGNLDDAFVRRLAFSVHFPFPDAKQRLRIWQGVWPAGVPLADGLSFAGLAESLSLSGGNIRNVALAAAYLAAEDGEAVTLAHLLHGVRREYQKMGKTMAVEELMERLGPEPTTRVGAQAGARGEKSGQ